MSASFTTYSFKPQLKTVGPKYGKLLGKIRTALSEVDGNTAMDELEGRRAPYTSTLTESEVVLTEEDLLIDMAQTEGYVSEADNERNRCSGHQPDSGADRGRLRPRDRQQDPDHA